MSNFRDLAARTGKRTGTRIGTALLALALVLSVANGPVHALPQGGRVVYGDDSITTPAQASTITQLSEKMIIEWNSFSIAEGETVIFRQPSAQAVVLNRVTGTARSDIFGNLVADGRVFLINPRGILFGPNARVDVAGLLATTHTLSDSDFLADRLSLKSPMLPSGQVVGEVINEGEIAVKEGGYAILLGRSATNRGAIRTPGGIAALMAGWDFDLRFDEDGALQYEEVLGADFARGVTNAGTIEADGGTVLLKGTVWSQRNLTPQQRQVVNVEGVVQAGSLGEREGRIVLDAANGTAVFKNGSEVTGDHVDVSGQAIHVDPGATINASHLAMNATSELVTAGLSRINMFALNGESSVRMHGGYNLKIEGELEWQDVPDRAHVYLGSMDRVLIDNAHGVRAFSRAPETSELIIEAPDIETVGPGSAIGGGKVTLKSGDGRRINLGGFVETGEHIIHFGGDVEAITISDFAGNSGVHKLRLFGADGPGSTLTVASFEIVNRPTHLYLSGNAHFGGELVVAKIGDLTLEDYAANVPSVFTSDSRIVLVGGRAFKNHTSLDDVLFPGEAPVFIYSRLDTFGYTPGALTFPEQYGFDGNFLSSLDQLSPNTIYIRTETPSPVIEIAATSGGTAIYSGAVPELDPSELAVVQGDASALDDLQLRLEGGTWGSGADADTYRLVPSAVSADYRVKYIPGTFTILPRELTYATDSFTRVYGDPNPELTGTVYGLVAGQTMADAGLSFHTAATQFANVGTYPIVLVQDPNHRMARNYIINHEASSAGNVTINRANIQFVVADQTKLYGDPAPASEVINILGFKGDERPDGFIRLLRPVVVPTVDDTADVGVYPWKVELPDPSVFSEGGLLRNYQLDPEAPVLGSLTVLHRPLIVVGDTVYVEVRPPDASRLYYREPKLDISGVWGAAPFHSLSEFRPYISIFWDRSVLHQVGRYEIYPEVDLTAPIFKNYLVFVNPVVLDVQRPGNLSIYLEEGWRVIAESNGITTPSGWFAPSIAGFPVESWPVILKAIATFLGPHIRQDAVLKILRDLLVRSSTALGALMDHILHQARLIVQKPAGERTEAERAFLNHIRNAIRKKRAEEWARVNTPSGSGRSGPPTLFILTDTRTDWDVEDPNRPIGDDELKKYLFDDPDEVRDALQGALY